MGGGGAAAEGRGAAGGSAPGEPEDAAAGGPPAAAVVASSWVPVRREPAHVAEMTSQWLCGEVLRVLETRDDWLLCRGADGYEGWAAAGGLLRTGSEAAGAWRRRAGARSLGVGLRPEPEAADPPAAARLPIGAPARLLADGRVELPDGVLAALEEAGRVVAAERLPTLFPREGAAVVRTAERWLGAPYLWGGRTECGVDCSGLVQGAYRLHGVDLPRDSRDQRRAGEDVGEAGGLPTGLLPGDLIFFAPEGSGISHVALSAGGTRILHASASNGRVAYDDLASGEGVAARLRGAVVACTRLL